MNRSTRFRIAYLLLAAVGALVISQPALADLGTIDPTVVREDAKLTASDAAANDWFGFSVALSGDTAVVGVFSDNHLGANAAGSAYVFQRSGTSWSEQAKLTASDAAPRNRFGYSVALSGDTAVVGAYLDDHAGGMDAGSAYVFQRSGTGWSEQAKLTASDAAFGNWFGFSVAISGDTAVVVALNSAAYVFQRSGTSWSERAKLIASDATATDLFGFSVGLSGDTAVVGAPFGDNAGGTLVGSAYVFQRSGTSWSEQAKLTASDAAFNDVFGYSVAASGDTVLVGADGSAYVFQRSGTSWSEQAKLIASDAAVGDFFGFSVAVSCDSAVVGAPFGDNAGGTHAGAVYDFVRSGTTWSEQFKLTASDAATGDFFGRSVALSGYLVVVGASFDDHAGGTDAGSAYVFDFEPRCPIALLTNLFDTLLDLNIQHGIENSLGAKLNAAIRALDDVNQNNNVAAIETLEAFINAVDAQRGNHITETDADLLIAAAQEIIDLLLA